MIYKIYDTYVEKIWGVQKRFRSIYSDIQKQYQSYFFEIKLSAKIHPSLFL